MTPHELSRQEEHLFAVLSGERFLKREGLSNEVPFFIYPYEPEHALDVAKAKKRVKNRLASKGIEVREINLYDLCIALLQAREGSSDGTSLWDDILRVETEVDKDNLLELLQNVLGIEDYLIPAIAERLRGGDYDVLFLCGIGEVFPYIRSHNVLNNLQSTAKDKPTVLFFPGEYRHSLAQGASLELFGLLHDDKYYRAFNIFETQA